MIYYSTIVNAVVLDVAMNNDVVSFQDCIDATIKHYRHEDSAVFVSLAIGKIATVAWEFLKDVLDEDEIVEGSYEK